jgi:hypothetical protein
MGSWYIDNIRIIVTDLDEEDKSIVAKLNPLGGGTVHQYWGWEETGIGVKAYVVGKTDRDALAALERDGTTHNLIASGFSNSDWNTTTTVVIEDIKWSNLNVLCQTIRPDLPENSRVYLASFTLSTEEEPDL